MGKTERRRVAKKAAPKIAVKGGMNGRAAHVAKRTLKTSAAKAARPRVSRGNGSIMLPEGYRPSESEPFMNHHQRIYFRGKLLAWKEEIVRQNRETLQVLHEDSAQHADLADRATSETDRALELRARDRQRKLIAKIDAALARIEEGTYGYCEETGEPIGLRRLDARPIATLSLEAQERHERREKVFRED
jgi:DnaK suppressor protein